MLLLFASLCAEAPSLYYWNMEELDFENFGDYLSLVILQRITNGQVESVGSHRFIPKKKLLAIGSILHFASNDDVIWGAGINGKHPNTKDYHFTKLDVRAVRGPLTRRFLMKRFQIECPEVYGDPALLLPYIFPELKRKENPSYEYIVIPHFTEEHLFPKEEVANVVYPTEPWDVVVEKILDSKFVIASSLHGLVVAEAFGIPARLLKVTRNEPLFKYSDYYLGTGRPHFHYASSVKSALKMGGEKPIKCDLQKLFDAFPFEFWPEVATTLYGP